MANMAAAQKFRGFRSDEMIAAARAAWVTQITPELEREGGLAMKAHGDAPLSVFHDARSAVWQGRDCKVKVLCRVS
jgi:class 3 adenylate cyclase